MSWLTILQAARAANVSTSSVYRLVRRGELVTRIGARGWFGKRTEIAGTEVGKIKATVQARKVGQ